MAVLKNIMYYRLACASVPELPNLLPIAVVKKTL